jgi:hypothetical protein
MKVPRRMWGLKPQKASLGQWTKVRCGDEVEMRGCRFA